MKKKYFIYFVLLVMLLAVLIEKQVEISEYDSIIRLHIISNDLSPEAKATKLLVRDDVLAWLNEQKVNTLPPKEANTFISTKLSEIKKVANNTLAAIGLSQNVSIQFGKTNIPAKMYQEKGFTLPGGQYQTLNVRIGDAKGQNWWCVAYPTQCLTDKTAIKVEDSEKVVLKLKFLEWLKLNPELKATKNAFKVYQNSMMENNS